MAVPVRRRGLARPLAAGALLAGMAASLGCGGGGKGAGPGSGPPTPPPAPAVGLSGTPTTWDAYRLVVPGTMTAAPGTDALALDKNGCRITIWRPVPALADLDGQALALLQAGFSDPQRWSGLVGENRASPLDEAFHWNGITSQGWPYVELRGQLLDTRGIRSGEHVRILVVNAGGQAAYMIGWQTVTGCIDEVLDPYEWVLLSYSLELPGRPGDRAALGRSLWGGWFGAEANQGVAWSDVFAANGHHADLVGVETYRQIGPGQILETFSTWQGNGWWTASGNLLSLWWTDPARPPRTEYFRVFRETGGFTYRMRLGFCGDHYCEGWETKD
jgi:hypothetical protein